MSDTERYPAGDVPAENSFDLSDPLSGAPGPRANPFLPLPCPNRE